ncbi:MAG: DUF6807 family protein [Verrucomicrobiota bacterium]
MMVQNNSMKRALGVVCGALASLAAAAEPAGSWTTATRAGRVEASHGETLLFAWQSVPLAAPVGGAKFAASAFLHPLRTPAGFEWTTVQPADHLHHLGLWWPWKFIEVDGERYNCWEIQEGQGGHVARAVKQLDVGPDRLGWEFTNEVVVRKPGGEPRAVIRETATVGLALRGSDALVLDIVLRQHALAGPVTIVNYRYSGFSWRGSSTWNKDNSRMLTSGGQGRDDANGQPARWVVVSGPTPGGSASVLLMSAASEVAGTPDRLRVWDSKTGNGTPFVNFNPVVDTALPLDDAHPAVSNRKYRVVAADHLIDATAAEAEWRQWQGRK